MENLALSADGAKIRSQGVLDGLSAAVKLTQKEYDLRLQRKKEHEAAVSRGETLPEDGLRPILPAAEDIATRRAETKKKRDLKDGKNP